MSFDLDAWLNAVDTQLPGLTAQELDRRILALRRDIDAAQVKIGILQQFREQLVRSQRTLLVSNEAAVRRQGGKFVREFRAATGRRYREYRLPDGQTARVPIEPAEVSEPPARIARGAGEATPQRRQVGGVASREAPEVERYSADQASASPAPRLSATRKREEILSLMRERPDHQWSPKEVREVLEARGLVSANDEGTPTRALLLRMTERGMLTKVAKGRYGVAKPNALTESEIQRSPGESPE